MFNNLSKRERIMAFVVGALLPVFLGFWLVSWIGGGLQKKTDEINRLSSEATRLKAQSRNARFAVARLGTYRKESLPKDGKRSALAFRNWLEDLGKEYDLENARVSPANLPVKMGTGENLAMEIYKYTFNGTGTPRQVTSFLYRLNETKLLIRTALKIQPETEGRADRAKMTGRWSITLTIDVACLPDEEREGLFDEETRPFSRRPLEEYHEVVSRRNLHGPENEKTKIRFRK